MSENLIYQIGTCILFSVIILTGCEAHEVEKQKEEPKQPQILTAEEQEEFAKTNYNMVAEGKQTLHEKEIKEKREQVKREKEEAERKAKEEQEAKEQAEREALEQAEAEKAQEDAQQAHDPANMPALQKAQWENANFADVHQRANYLVANPNHLNNVSSDADSQVYLNALNDNLQSSGEMQLEYILNN